MYRKLTFSAYWHKSWLNENFVLQFLCICCSTVSFKDYESHCLANHDLMMLERIFFWNDHKQNSLFQFSTRMFDFVEVSKSLLLYYYSETLSVHIMHFFTRTTLLCASVQIFVSFLYHFILFNRLRCANILNADRYKYLSDWHTRAVQTWYSFVDQLKALLFYGANLMGFFSLLFSHCSRKQKLFHYQAIAQSNRYYFTAFESWATKCCW